MELSRKPSGNQETQQTKRLGSLNVRGQVNKSKEEAGTQFERKEESYERRTEEFDESGGMTGTDSFGGDHKAFGGDQKSFGGNYKSFGGDKKSFGGDHKPLGGDHKKVTSDVLPGVSTVSLSFVSQKNLNPIAQSCLFTYTCVQNLCICPYSCDKHLLFAYMPYQAISTMVVQKGDDKNIF